jgi:hypothetical protein
MLDLPLLLRCCKLPLPNESRSEWQADNAWILANQGHRFPTVTLVFAQMTASVLSTRDTVEPVEAAGHPEIFIHSKYDRVSALRIVKLTLSAHSLQNVALTKAAAMLEF